MKTACFSSHCIFCTSQCPSSFTIINGKPVKLKIENEPESKPFLSGNFEPSAQDDSCIESHLKVMFILRKILDMEVTTFSMFLGKCEGQFHPGLWISLCSSCDQLVREFWEKLKEVGRLERRLKGIKSQLTGFVQDTRAFNGNGAGEDPVWTEIRTNVVAELGSTNDVEEKFHIERLMLTTQENEDKFADKDDGDGEEPLIKVELLDNKQYKNVEEGDDPTYYPDPLSDSNLQTERRTKMGRAGKFGCSICSKSFDSKERLKTHCKNYHTPISCKSCDKTLTSLQHLKGHVRRVHPEKGSFQCPTCCKMFASRFKLWRHKRYIHEKGAYHCSTCSRSFKSASSISYHVNTVHKPASVPCPHCQIVFCHKRTLSNHLKLKHSGRGKPKPVTCSKCGKLFSSSRTVTRHIREVHGVAPKLFSCSECNVVVKSKQQLNFHIKAVHNPEMHICQICTKSFTTAKYLNQHVTRNHSTPAQKESWVKCPKCDKSFYKNFVLKRHFLRSSCRPEKCEETKAAAEQD